MTRIVVVGGGIVGTTLALAAVDRGHDVVQLERDEEPRGASARNFGLIWVGGRAGGRELALALEGRRLWGELAARAPRLRFRSIGSLVVARTRPELDVLAAAYARDDAPHRSFSLLSPDEARALNPALGDVLGALHSPLDAVVEPAAALSALRRIAAASNRYRFLPGRTVVGVDTGGATDHTGERHDADVVVVCTGDAAELLPPDLVRSTGLIRRNLQMLETEALDPAPTTAIAGGDALRYYPVFDLPERAALPPPEPVVERLGAQVLLVPRADGRLTLGDTHVDDAPGAFGSVEAADEYFLRQAEALLSRPLPPVRRRWTGSYLRRTDGRDPILVHDRPGGLLVVGAAGGLGMTAAPAIAIEALSRIGL